MGSSELIGEGVISEVSVTYESFDDHWSDHFSFSLSHLLTDSQQHQHVVTLTHTHSIQVTQDIGTGYLTLTTQMNGVGTYCYGYKHTTYLHVRILN